MAKQKAATEKHSIHPIAPQGMDGFVQETR